MYQLRKISFLDGDDGVDGEGITSSSESEVEDGPTGRRRHHYRHRRRGVRHPDHQAQPPPPQSPPPEHSGFPLPYNSIAQPHHTAPPMRRRPAERQQQQYQHQHMHQHPAAPCSCTLLDFINKNHGKNVPCSTVWSHVRSCTVCSSYVELLAQAHVQQHEQQQPQQGGGGGGGGRKKNTPGALTWVWWAFMFIAAVTGIAAVYTMACRYLSPSAAVVHSVGAAQCKKPLLA